MKNVVFWKQNLSLISRHCGCNRFLRRHFENGLKFPFRLSSSSSSHVKAIIGDLSKSRLDEPESVDGRKSCPISLDDDERIKNMKAEYEIWKYADTEIPDDVSDNHWKIMLTFNTVKERLRYLTNLHKKKTSKELRRKERQFKAAEHQAQFDNMNAKNDKGMHYEYGGNFILQRIQHQIITKWATQRAAFSSMVSKFTVIYDLSLFEQLSLLDQKRAAYSLQSAYYHNITHRQPGNIIFSSLDRNSVWFNSFFPGAFLPDNIDDYIIKTTEKHYTELYPLKQLVYLSPDAKYTMKSIDEDKAYIIGPISTFTFKPMLTLGEAKKRGIESVRLPLDQFLKWGRGNKRLSANVVQSILLDFYMTNDWRFALTKNVPTYNFIPLEERTTDDKIKLNELKEYREQREEFLLSLVASHKR